MRVVVGRRFAAVCASALVLTGCANSTQGTPAAGEASSLESTTVTAGPEPFDPCTIPKSAVTASGLDVSTERPDFAGITTYPGWKNCAWDGPSDNPWYFFLVQSSINSLDQYLSSPQNVGQVPVQIGPRAAVQHNIPGDGVPPEGCSIAFDAGGNLIILILHKIGSKDLLGDPCIEVAKHAEDLQSYLPK
ncbi:DUF3558 domain-containing protein [Rhodococcus sp. 14-2483-1-2]|uniref:DUF3558 domain-containing protein n=1 Tax=Rhodococcus sp. 14-2483-1-2 TaxID=2023147 RepID=UPI000B9C24FE|nr:DUF3558 domain-containing protein [Rhodococcus sp. 14-2483-1-2]OZF29504.1 hypothetical protein CH295_18390 [Rhodococcus sp. 14-2483-1-2]